MKKFILTLLIGIMIGIIPSAFAIAKLFSDVEQDQWYTDAVYSLTEKGIIEGYEDSTYRPSNSVNRAELAVMLDRLLIHLENEKVRLGLLSEEGAFAVMQSYDRCLSPDASFEDVDLDFEQIDGVSYWITDDWEFYCKINANTGEMEEYYFMPI